MNWSKAPKSLSLIGLAMTVSGVAFKLNHLAGAHTLTNIGVLLLVLGLLMWAGQTLRKSDPQK
jgi:hypothetical protein